MHVCAVFSRRKATEVICVILQMRVPNTFNPFREVRVSCSGNVMETVQKQTQTGFVYPAPYATV